MHRATGNDKRYGFWAFAIDLISIPVTVVMWTMEKAINGCAKIIDSVSNS